MIPSLTVKEIFTSIVQQICYNNTYEVLNNNRRSS